MTDADNRPAVVGKVERPVRPGAEARWYCLSREGMATLCVDEEDARANAAHCDQAWRAGGPHRAVRLVDGAELAKLRAALGAVHWRVSRPDTAFDDMTAAVLAEVCEQACPELRALGPNRLS